MADGEQSRGGESGGAVRPGALSALLLEIASAPADGGDAWDGGLRAGAVVGRFELVRELGRGGFGVVWEAKDRELGRRVAFKAVRAGARRDLREERLLREAEAAARLSHPNIVTLFDVGRSEHGPYLVLELLEGRTLAERLAHGALPLREAVRVAVEIAKGLAHAHAHGVVHRDLKPENVFLCADGQVKVLDLGLAHAFGRRRAEGGTPSYMAPEQLEGAPEDERTDVFALGLILHEMLAGERPFADEQALRSPRSAPALDVPGDPALGGLVSRMLAKQPVRRPREASEVLGALVSFASELDRAPAVVGRIGTRRRPDWRIAAGIAALAVLPAAAAVWWVASRSAATAPAARADGRVLVAVADMVNETGERELDVLSGLLVTSLEQSRRLAVMTQARVLDLAARAGRKDATRVDETVGREVGRAHGVRALLLPAVRRLGATYSMEMRAIDPRRDEHLFTLSDRATSKEALLDLLDRLSEKARARLGEGQREIDAASVQLGEAMTRSLNAYRHYLSAVEAWGGEGLRAVALRELEEALRRDPGFAAAHVELGLLLHHSYGKPELARPHFDAADAGLERMPEKERLLYRLTRAHYSSTFRHFSREEAVSLAEEALARFPDDKYAITSAAEAFETFDLPDRWEPALRRALELDPGYFWAAGLLAEWLGPRTGDALAVARSAVATRRSPANLSILARALWATGDEEGAVAAAGEVLRGEGGRHSLLAARACDVLREKGLGADCLPVWERMASDGLNEHERDFARARLMDGLVHQGRMREALRLARNDPDFVKVANPGWLAAILQVGHPRTRAPAALAAARRIPNPQIRRNFLTWLGATEEADRITTSLEGKGYELVEKTNRAMRLLNRGLPAEAAEVVAAIREEVHRRNYPGNCFGLARAHAEALLAAGRAEAAAATWPAALPCRCTDPVDHANHYPSLALIRARAMEQLGRRGDAIREVDGVLAFWKDADADLPLLVEAKAMRARLAKEAGRPAAAAVDAPAGPSIAVLPFADLSPAKDHEHLSDGVAEEILNALTQVQGLRVVGRTSSFSFKGKDVDLRTIGRRLDAANVLEGSVRRDGDRVRVTARLVSAANGYRVWSETYERQDGGIFQIQDEIARAVVGALAVKLVPGRRLAAAPTTTPEAYDLYLQAKRLYRRFSLEGLRGAVERLERAVERDPRYAPAWAALGIPLFYLARDAATGEEERRLEARALAAAERSLELAPDLADGLSTRGFLRQALAWDWAGARADLERAVRLYPSDPDAWRRYGVLLDNLGRSDEAVAALERAVRLDPLGFSILKLGQVQLSAGRLAAAGATGRRAREVLPASPIPRLNLALFALLEGRAEEALAAYEDARSWDFPGAEHAAGVTWALHALGRAAEAEAALARLQAAPRVRPHAVALTCAWMQRPDCAFEWLDRAVRERDSGLGEGVLHHPFVRPLHPDPRWKALLRRMNLPADL